MELLSLCTSHAIELLTKWRTREQGPVEGGLAFAREGLPRYKCIDKGCNKLGDKGVTHLSKAQWGEIETVGIDNKMVTKTQLQVETVAAGSSAGPT